MARPRHSTTDFSPLSREWLDEADPLDRKERGQYLTPRGLRERLLDRLELAPGMRILDPGVGTGEFLAAAIERQPGVRVTGWDTDPEILGVARALVPDAELMERSAIDPWGGDPFDLVIGNPPYFQFRATPAQRQRYAEVISGRPNIFALFFQAGLEAVVEGGRLAFVVPPSLNNGAYFESLREYVIDNAVIEHLEVMEGSDLFEGANTAVQLIVLRKGSGSSERFTLARESKQAGFRRVIFTDSPRKLSHQFEGRQTLWELGYAAATGTIVWNQNRELLRRSARPGTLPLVWARNLSAEGLKFDGNPERPEFIVSDQPQHGPAVLVNRVVGSVGRGELRAVAIPDGEPFLAENHVNVLTPRAGAREVAPASQVAGLINGEGVSERVRLLTGNSQISARELTHLLPL